jgi:hypothetical protein
VWKKIHWQHYLGYAIAAAIVYAVPIIFYLKQASYTNAWLLYLGNFFFLFVITAFLFSFNSRRNQDASTVTMLTAGHITTAMGVVIACFLCFILLLIMVPGIFNGGNADKMLADAPANTVKDKTGGMSFMIFANAVFGNVVAGSFVSIVFPFVLKKNQKNEKVPRKQAEL